MTPIFFMKKLSHQRIVILLLFCFFPAVTLFAPPFSPEAPTQDSQSHEVSVVLKLIQVFVTDSRGRSILDLNADDFTVTDNGKTVEITEFERHTFEIPEIRDTKETQPEAKETPARRGRHFYLLLDFFHNDRQGIRESKKSAGEFIRRTMQPGDAASILSYETQKGFQIHASETRNQERLLSTLEGIKAAPRNANSLSEEWLNNHSRDYIQAFRALASYLKYEDGYKYVVLLSSGMSRQMLYGTVSESEHVEFREVGLKNITSGLYDHWIVMAEELMAANCMIYAVNSNNTRMKTGVTDISSNSSLGDHSLQLLSQKTGGMYFPEVSYVEQITRKIHQITGNYYVLGYYITEKVDNKFHRIRVNVRKKGCQAHTPQGYYNPKPYVELTDFEKKIRRMSLIFGEFSGSELLHFGMTALHQNVKGISYAVVIAELDKILLEDQFKGGINIYQVIMDEDRNTSLFSQGWLSSDLLKKERTLAYSVTPLGPGSYRSRMVLQDKNTGKAAVGITAFAIPVLSEEGIQMDSPILLCRKEGDFLRITEGDSGQTALAGPSIKDIFPFVSNQYIPVIAPVDKDMDKLYAVIRSRTGPVAEPDVELSARLLLRSQEKEWDLPLTILAAAEMEGSARILLRFDLPELERGRYSIEIAAHEHVSKTETKGKSDFEVK